MTPHLSHPTAVYLLDLAKSELEGSVRDPDARRAVRELTEYLAQLDRPNRYTLRQVAGGWQIGALDGILLPTPVGEYARGLSALELALTYPGDPVRLTDFLDPGVQFKSEHGLARKLISVTTRWIEDEADVELGRMIAECTQVTLDDLNRPVLRVTTRLPMPVATS